MLRVLGLACVAMMLAGCAVVIPDPYQPQRVGYEWTSTEERLWVARLTQCGFCPVAPAEGRHHVLAVFEDGAILRFSYNLGGAEGLAFANKTWQKYHPMVTRVWQELYADKPDQMTVVALAARQLAVKDADPVLRVLDHGLRAAKDPGPPTYDCADCAGVSYRTFAPPQAFNVTLGHPLPDDEGWRTVEGQLDLVSRWLDNPPQQRPVG